MGAAPKAEHGLHRIVVVALAFLSACSAKDDRVGWMAPDPRLVAMIDSRLASFKCIGPIGRWERRYRYEPGRIIPDLDRIEFDLREAGRFGIKPGRFILASPPPGVIVREIDDTPVDVASGSYDIGRRRLTLSFCGPNVSPPRR
jgi:hypothetical protein